jgi:hypothetical protein
MSTSMLVPTIFVFPLPFIIAFLAWRVAPPPASNVLWAAACFVALIWLSIWMLFRPSAFEISNEGLRIRWPLRQRAIELGEVVGASIVSGREFRAEYGRGKRFGAGGLWGGFGLLLTQKGPLNFYVSRLDQMVLLHLRTQKPLLISPDRPEQFIASLRDVGAPLPAQR